MLLILINSQCVVTGDGAVGKVRGPSLIYILELADTVSGYKRHASLSPIPPTLSQANIYLQCESNQLVPQTGA